MFHGPPVSDYTGDRPCGTCITTPGFPNWEPVKETEFAKICGIPITHAEAK